jgi:hypothetical protein
MPHPYERSSDSFHAGVMGARGVGVVRRLSKWVLTRLHEMDSGAFHDGKLTIKEL